MKTPRMLIAGALVVAMTVTELGAIQSSSGAALKSTIDVRGSVHISSEGGDRYSDYVVLVHDVRRVDGGTVVYLSVGAPADAPGSYVQGAGLFEASLGERYSLSSTSLSAVHMNDPANHQVYSALVQKENGAPIASNSAVSWPIGSPKGQLLVQYVVFAALPTTTKTVDITIGYGNTIQSVPVTDGLLTPEVDPNKPIPLGTGWPRVDLNQVKSALKPNESVYPWVTAASTLDNAVTARQTPKQESVDLASDVLFATDQATLTSAAQNAINEAAKQVNASAQGGAISIIGYTDNTGTDAHNLDLSQRRARAVSDALKPLLTVSGLNVSTDGKGEQNPIADNGTDAGRQANRRVTVSFTPKGN